MNIVAIQVLPPVPALSRQQGFTMVELVMVIIIAGILATFVAPRFFDADVFQSRGATDQVRASLRYGQKIAIAQRRNVDVQLSAAVITNCEGQLAAGNVVCVISNRVALPNQTLTFNALGQPVPNVAAAVVVGTAPNDTTITIEAETGYVH